MQLRVQHTVQTLKWIWPSISLCHEAKKLSPKCPAHPLTHCHPPRPHPTQGMTVKELFNPFCPETNVCVTEALPIWEERRLELAVEYSFWLKSLMHFNVMVVKVYRVYLVGCFHVTLTYAVFFPNSVFPTLRLWCLEYALFLWLCLQYSSQTLNLILSKHLAGLNMWIGLLFAYTHTHALTITLRICNPGYHPDISLLLFPSCCPGDQRHVAAGGCRGGCWILPASHWSSRSGDHMPTSNKGFCPQNHT